MSERKKSSVLMHAFTKVVIVALKNRDERFEMKLHSMETMTTHQTCTQIGVQRSGTCREASEG